jgi:mono/diheme cytochrome c family protein
MPIGIKIRNLNREVVRNNATINQLLYLQNAGIINAVVADRFTRLPNWQQDKNSITERVRAYLDVNCAHCHSDKGSCARSGLRFAWEMPLADTRIEARKKQLINMMEKGRMPRIGTTIVDAEALALIKKYLQSQ